MAFRILSLDGGGTWALVQARVLLDRYPDDPSGHEILRKYDMAIANSGGSLVLALLCADFKPSKIVSIFNDVNVLQAIFKKKFVSRIPKLKEFLPNYETENKFKVFQSHLKNGISYGDKLLTELPGLIKKESLQIIITGFDYDRERAIYFRSNFESMMEGYKVQNAVVPGSAKFDFKAVTLAQAVHAASNAPVQFFDNPAAFELTKLDEQGGVIGKTRTRLYWDGAVGGNTNPVKSGVLEALANKVDPADIEIVSIGTANTIQPVIYGEKTEPNVQYEFLCRYSKMDGWIEDLGRMASSILSDPPDAASFDSHQILRLPYEQNTKRLVRINPLIKPILVNNQWIIPGKSGQWTRGEMEMLFTMDMAITTVEGVRLINKLCDDYFADAFDNQGIRLGGEKLDAILGHKLYSHAKADWR
jgi:hypothetical protein